MDRTTMRARSRATCSPPHNSIGFDLRGTHGRGRLFTAAVFARRRSPRFLWQPCGCPSAAGMVVGKHLLSYLSVRSRRYSACKGVRDKKYPWELLRADEPQRQRHRRSWLCHPDLRLRNAGAGRPSVGQHGGSLWQPHRRFEWNGNGHDHGAGRRHHSVYEVWQYQRLDVRFRISSRNSRCAGTAASITT